MADLAAILSLGKQLEALAEVMPKAIKEWLSLFDELKRRKEANNLKRIVFELQHRLFTRYGLIEALENIIERGSLSQVEFKALIVRFSKRIDFLEEFNEEIPVMIATLSADRGNPKLASEIEEITRTSILLYGEILDITDTDEFLHWAPDVAKVLKGVAAKLEMACTELKALTIERSTK